MKAEEIINLALDCGIGDCDLSHRGESVVTDYGNSTDDVLRFAAKIAEIEREACARLCEELISYDEDDPGTSYSHAIRARSKA